MFSIVIHLYVVYRALHNLFFINSDCTKFGSFAQSCPTLCDPRNCSTPGLPVRHQLPEPAQTCVHESLMPSSHLILCCPLLLLPSVFPSIRVFSNESALCIRWPECWSFSFSVRPSGEHSGSVSLAPAR